MSDFFKKIKPHYGMIFRTVLMTMLPLLGCLIYCAGQGKSIGDVYLPASPWNDELFYFKQVEGIVNYGIPQGYFGFNESHALRLSFSSWSPLLVFPWVIWGLLFGWNFLTPIVFNIIFMTAAVLLFMILAQPDWKQTGILALLYMLFSLNVRYMLSGMPETICFSMLIIFYGITIRYLNLDEDSVSEPESKTKAEKKRLSMLILLFLLSGLMTLMRPYLLLFMLLPIFLSFRRYRWKGLLCAAAATGVTLGIYVWMNHYYTAEYLEPLYYMDWLTTFFRKGIGAGLHYFFGTMYWSWKEMKGYLIQGFRSGHATGAFFDASLAVLLVILCQGIVDFFGKHRKEKEKQLILELHYCVSCIGMLFAQLLMYNLYDGCKHFLTFIIGGIFVLAMLDTKTFKKAAFVGAIFAYLFMYKARTPYDYQVPFQSEETLAQYESWKQIFEEKMVLSEENTPSYDNTVIWTLYDIRDGSLVYSKWQILYGIPKGMAISCCEQEYVMGHMEELRSRYIMTMAGESVDQKCRSLGYKEIGRDEDVVVYARY